MYGIDGKVALVAGGAGALGSATSLRLGKEGASVVVGDLNHEAATAIASAIVADGGTAIGVEFDIADDESVAALVTAAVEAFGGVDLCLANAADLSILGEDTNALTVDLEVLERTLQVNLVGFLLCTRHVVPRLVERGGGAIVYTSSAASFIGEPVRPSYAMAKSGVNALMRHIASRFGRQRIRANAIAPGLILTEHASRTLSTEVQESMLKGTRSWRLGRPEDVAGLVAFLLSSDAEWINGQVISLDGGVTMR